MPTPNMSIFTPTNGQELFSAAFLAGMENVDQHDHSGAPDNGVPIGTAGIQDGAITPAKLSFTLFSEESIETTDATPTNISAIAVADSHTITVRGIFASIRDNGAESLGGSFSGTFFRSAGGLVAVVGATSIDLNSNFSGTADFYLNANTGSNDIEMVCVGEAGSDIIWTVQYSYIDRDTTL